MTRRDFRKHPLNQAPGFDERHWTFLTPTQAVDAAALDFQAYGPQPDLFRSMAPLVLGERCRITLSGRRSGSVSILQGDAFYPVDDQQLGFYLIHLLETDPPGLDTLARICEMVFQTRTAVGHDSTGCTSGIWVHSQMDAFVCRQCGKCCHDLNYETGCTESDIRRWHDMGRTDILAWVKCRNRSANSPEGPYRIWVDPDTEETARICPWLARSQDPALFVCIIHAVKPEVCRQYPYTAKHAAMTDCQGLFVAESIAENHDPKGCL